MKKVFAIITILSFVLSNSIPAFADNWVGTTNGDFNIATNWSSNPTALASSDPLVFTSATGAGILSLTNDESGFTYDGISFSSGAAAFTIGGNAFFLTNNITNNSTNIETIDVNSSGEGITLTGNSSFSTTAGQLAIASNVDGSGNLALQNNSSTNQGVLLSGTSVDNVGTITNSGTGSGSTVISAAVGSSVTAITEDGTGGSELLISGALTPNAGGSTILTDTAGQLTITGGVTSGDGNLVLDNNTSTTGGITIEGAAIDNFGTITNSGTGASIISANIGANVNGLSQTSSTLILSGDNTYTGNTTVSAGSILNIQNAAALGSSATTVASGADLQLQGGISTESTEGLTISGTGISGSGALENVSGNNTFGGAIALVGNTQINDDTGSLTLSGQITGTANLTLDNNSTTGVDTVTLSGLVDNTGTITNSGTGATGDNTVISGGVGGNVTGIIEDSANSNLDINTGAITIGSTTTLTDMEGNLDVSGNVGGSGNLVLNNDSTNIDGITLSGTVNNSGNIINSGTVSTGSAVATLISGNIGSNVVDITENSPTGSALNITGSIAVNGTSGTTLIDTAGQLTASGGVTGGGNLILENNTATTGGITLSGSGSSIDNTGTIINNGSGTGATVITGGIGSSVTGIIENGSSALDINTNAITLGGSGTTTTLTDLSGNLDVSGGVTGTGNLMLINNSGTASGINISGTTTPQNIDNIGTITNGGSGSSTMISAGIGPNVTGIIEDGSSTLNVSGTVTIGGASTTLTDTVGQMNVSGNVTGTGELVIQNNTNNIGGITISGAVDNSGTIFNSGTATGGSTVISGGIGPNVTAITEYDQNGGDSLSITTNAITIGSTTTLTDTQGLLTVANGTPSALDVTGTGNLILNNNSGTNGGIVLTAAAIDNTGTITNSGLGNGSTTISGGIGGNVTGIIENSLGGSTLTIETDNVVAGSSGLTLTDAAGQTGQMVVQSDIAGPGNLVLQNNSGVNQAINISGTVDNTGTGGIINNGTAGSVVISGAIGIDVTGVTQNSTGSMLILQGTNDYLGPTTVSAGILNIQNAYALGCDTEKTNCGTTTVANGAQLQIEGTISTSDEALTLNGTGISGTGALENVSGNNIYNGAITLGGTPTVSVVSDAGALTLNGGITGTGNLILDNDSTTASGVMTLSGSPVNNTGTITNSGTSSSNATVISGGVGPNVTGIIENADSALDITNTAITIASSGSTTLTDDAGNLNVTGGVTSVTNSGTSNLVLENNSATPDGINISGTTVDNSGTITNAGTNTGSGSVAISAAIGSGVTAINQDSSTSALYLSGNSSGFNGNVNVNDGILNISNGNALGSGLGTTTVASGAELQIQGGITTANESLTLAGTGFNGSGALENVSGTNNYTGAITIQGLTQIISDTGASTSLTLSGGINGTGDLVLTNNNSTGAITLTGSSSIDNAGTITNNGGGTGSTVISGGVGSLVTGIIEDSTGSTLNITTNNIAIGSTTTLTDLEGSLMVTGAGVVGTGNLVLENDTSTTGGITISGSGGGASVDNTGTITNSGTGSGSTLISAAIGSNVTGIIENSGSSELNITGNIAVTGNTTLTDLQGELMATGGVSGTGNLILNNNTATTGGITLSTTSIDNSGTITNSGTSTGATVISAGIGTNVTGIIEDSTGSALDISGAITTNTGDTTTLTDSLGQLNVTGGVTGAGALVLNNNSNTPNGITLSGANIANSGTITNSGTGDSTLISADISSADGVTQDSSTSALFLSGDSSYGGATTVELGTLNIQNAHALGSSTTTVDSGNDAELQIQGGITTASNEALDLNGTGIAGSGALESVSGANNFAGTITLESASQINNDDTGNALTLSGGITGGNPLTIGGSGVTDITGTINSSVSSITEAGTGFSTGLNISSAITANTNGTTLINNSGQFDLTGGVIGTGNLVLDNNTATTGGINFSVASIDNTGTITNSGTGASTGSTEISGGVGSNVTGITEDSAGALNIDTTAITVHTGGTTLTDSLGNLNVSSGVVGTGNLVLDNNTATTGGINFSVSSIDNAGTITNSGTSTGSTVISGGVGSLVTGITENSQNSNLDINTNAITIGSTTTLTDIEGALMVTGGVSGTGNLVLKNNSGTGNGITISGSSVNNTGMITNSGTSGATVISGGVGSNVTSIIEDSVGGGSTLNITTDAITTGGTTTLTDTAGQLNVSGGVNGAGNIILDNNTATTGGITISGSGSAVNNTGTVTNSGTSTGSTVISGGVGPNVTSIIEDSTGSALNITSNAISLNGNTMTLTDTSGQLTVSGGVSGNGSLVLDNNTATTGGITLAPSSGNVNFTGTVTNSGTGTGSSLISDAVGSAVTGIVQDSSTSTLFLTGNNGSYAGNTAVDLGILNVQGSNNALGSGGETVSVAGNGAEVQLQGGISVTASNMTLNGTGISNSGALENVSGSNTYSGDITLGSDSQINADASSTLTLAGGTITGSGTQNLTIAGAGNTAISSNIDSGVDSLTQASTGTLTLSGNNSYTGQTVLNAGILNLASSGAISPSSTINFGGGILQYSSSNQIDYSQNPNNSDINQFDVTDPGQQYNIDTQSYTVTLAGNITSAGGELTKLGSGTLILSGSNSFTGGTTLSDGILNLDNTEALGSSGSITFDGGTLQYSGNNTVDYSGRFSAAGDQEFNIDTNGESVTFDSNFTSSGGTLTKLGSGTLTINGDNGYTGGTTISAGTLAVGNANALGTGALTNDATLNLKTTSLSLGGTYTQSSGSTLDLTANSSSVYGNLTTAVAASVAGSTINVNVVNYLPNNAVLDVINTQAGVSLTGPLTVTSNDPFISFASSVEGNDIVLTTNHATAGFASLANNSNARAIGTVLDNVTNPSSDMTFVLNTLEHSTDAQITKALNTMGPIVDGGVVENTTIAMNNFVMTNIDRIKTVFSKDDIVSSALDKAESSFNPNGSGDPGDSGNSGVSSGDDESSVLKDVWAKEYGSYLHQGTLEGIQGYNSWNAGTVVGIDDLINNDYTLGVSAGYADSGVGSEINSASTDTQSAQGTVYLGWQDGSPYVDLVGFFAENWNNGQRDITVSSINRTADASYTSDQYGGYIDGGYRFDFWNCMDFTPLTSIQWTHTSVSSYHETGAGALDLNVEGQDYDVLESGLGGSISFPETYSWGKFTPELHAKWLHDFINNNMSVNSSFAGGGGSFTTTGATPSKNGANVGAKISVDFKNDISLIGAFDAEMKEDLFGIYGSGTVEYRF